MLRSARVMTVVVASALLLAALGSSVVALEVARLVIEPSAVEDLTVAVMTTVSWSPAAIVPRLSEPVQVADGPPLRVYVGLIRELLRTSVRTAPWASDGPLLVTVIV